MNSELREDPRTAIVVSLGIMALVAAITLMMSAPFLALFGGGYAYRGLIHGVSASLLMVAATVGLYQAYRLWFGGHPSLTELKAGSVAYVVAALATTISGNWIYIPYRANVPDSPRSYFLANSPEIHKVWFEFKEFSALFVLPLTVLIAYLIFSYRDDLLASKGLRRFTAAALVLAFFYFAVAFGLGAAVTKLKSV
ncbi:MAG: hypothetical protein AAB229_02170 [Candidatus Hydrogenedentota bacterium]